MPQGFSSTFKVLEKSPLRDDTQKTNSVDSSPLAESPQRFHSHVKDSTDVSEDSKLDTNPSESAKSKINLFPKAVDANVKKTQEKSVPHLSSELSVLNFNPVLVENTDINRGRSGDGIAASEGPLSLLFLFIGIQLYLTLHMEASSFLGEGFFLIQYSTISV